MTPPQDALERVRKALQDSCPCLTYEDVHDSEAAIVAHLDALAEIESYMRELERERDHWKWDHTEASKELLARAERAETEVRRLREALEEIDSELKIRKIARRALGDHSDPTGEETS